MIRRSLMAAAALVLTAAAQPAERIDREALVRRHTPELKQVDPHAPMMVGNGNLGFTADITGLQTFPEAYSPVAPLLTMAQWAWHSFPNSEGYTEADGFTTVNVPGRGEQQFAWMRSWADADVRPALTWLRENPHRFSLGRIALAMTRRDGRAASVTDITQPHQRLDMWTGTLTSRFRFDGAPVTVETRVHPDRDVVLVSIRSPLVTARRLGIDLRYPGVGKTINPDPSDWQHPDAHRTEIVAQTPGRWDIRRTIDDTVYWSSIQSPGVTVSSMGTHRYRIAARSGDTLTVAIGFERARGGPIALGRGAAAVADHWRRYWTDGGAIDFTGSTDPRAAEIERRIVLSQYLTAVNAAGTLPPQEEGLFSNSWNGKFHLEMHAWHAAHFAAWGRPGLMERGMGWYAEHLPDARARAARHGLKGAWWPKMTGPDGRNSPSTINPFIMWQQPHPIYLAEMAYRAHGDAATLRRYADVVEQTAWLLATYPRRDGERYVLGPPIIPVQENHPPLTTRNPLFELEYYRWGLQTAQQWRVRRGLPRVTEWDRVIAGMAPPPAADGLYLPIEGADDFWRVAASPACDGDASGEHCLNRDHPSFLMAYGLIGGDRIDPAAMGRTLDATKRHWDVRQTWGWDFPMIAMTAARLGRPEEAVDWLMRDLPNNQWGVTGMTPRVHLEAHAQQFLPSATTIRGEDGETYRRAAETYFPSNGSLLLATGMMAAGWSGSHGQAPGFPKQGWVVRTEGIQPIP